MRLRAIKLIHRQPHICKVIWRPIILLTLGFLATTLGHAAQINLQITPLLIDYEFKEFDNKRALNREHGSIPGTAVAISSNWHRLHISATASYAGDFIKHDGQSQTGNPEITRTNRQLYDYELFSNINLFSGKILSLDAIVGVGYSKHKRDIQSTNTATGVKENYRWQHYNLGSEFRFSNFGKGVWSLSAQRLWATNAKVDVQFKNDLDTARLQPQSATSYRFSLQWQRPVAQDWQAGIALTHLVWKFNDSPLQPLFRQGLKIGSIFQPQHKSRSTSYQLTLQKVLNL